MKRTDMVAKIASKLKALKKFEGVALDSIVQEYERQLLIEADKLLTYLESLGMKPPHISREDANAADSLYYGGFDYYQWDEELSKNTKLIETKERRKIAQEKREAEALARKESK